MDALKQQANPGDTFSNFEQLSLLKENYIDTHIECCPDCGDELRLNGRCRYCACCGWSTC